MNMNLFSRRRVLMGAGDKSLNFVSIVPSVLNWYKSGGGRISLISDDSLSANVQKGGWNTYVYSTRNSPFRYSDLIGKTIFIEFDTNLPKSNVTVGLGLNVYNNTAGGISAMQSRAGFSHNDSNDQYHFKRHTIIGTEWTTDTNKQNYWMSLYIFWYNESQSPGRLTISNLRCGYYEQEVNP